MSICYCYKSVLHISDEEIEQDEIKYRYIRCCKCSGKWGLFRLSDGRFKRFEEYYKRNKPSRYISKGDRYRVLKRQRWRCNFCDKPLKYSNNHKFGDEVAHIDHIHPFNEWESYNGRNINELSNLQALCPECNLKKKKKL